MSIAAQFLSIFASGAGFTSNSSRSLAAQANSSLVGVVREKWKSLPRLHTNQSTSQNISTLQISPKYPKKPSPLVALPWSTAGASKPAKTSPSKSSAPQSSKILNPTSNPCANSVGSSPNFCPNISSITTTPMMLTPKCSS